MKIKPGVDLRGLQPQMVIAVQVAQWVYGAQELTITSGSEGEHMAGSLHYKGLAVDIRLPAPDKIAVVILGLRGSLGKQYDVVLENDHIHIEFDPR